MTVLELKQRLLALEARVKELEPLAERIKALEFREKVIVKQITDEPKNKKLCPHCGVKPAYFFHVKNCQKNKNNGDDGNRDPGGT